MSDLKNSSSLGSDLFDLLGGSEKQKGPGFDFFRLYVNLNKTLPWIILFLVLSITGGYLYLRYTPEKFISKAILKLDYKRPDGFQIEGGSSFNNLSGEIQIVNSDILRKQIIQNLPLDVSYYKYGNVMRYELYRSSPFKLKYEIKDYRFYDQPVYLTILSNREFKLKFVENDIESESIFEFNKSYENNSIRFKVSPTVHFAQSDIGIEFSFVINSENSLMNYLRANQSASINDIASQTILVSFTDPTPLKAHDIVNTLDSMYLIHTIEKKNLSFEQTSKFIEQNLDSVQNELEYYEQLIFEILLKNGILSPQTITDELRKQYQALLFEVAQNRERLTILNELKSEVLTDSISTELYYLLLNIDEERITTSVEDFFSTLKYASLKRKRPGTKSLSAQKKEKRRNIDRDDLLLRIDALKLFINKKVSVATDSSISIQKKLSVLPNIQREIKKLERLRGIVERYYLQLLERKSELGINKASTVPDFQVLAPPNIPNTPISPIKTKIYLISVMIGLAFGLVTLAIRFLLDDTIIDHKDIERNGGIPYLGSIPRYRREKLNNSRLVVHFAPKSSVAESLRNIRSNLDFYSTGPRSRKIITVTSTISGEGKTFVALNLAGILAISKKKVVLLDFDMRKPKVHLAFGVENDTGVSTILSGKDNIEQAIKFTEVESLQYITSGPVPPNPSELILANELPAMLARLHQIYDIIIIDTPPVGIVNDGFKLMDLSDLQLYIARSGYSKRNFLKTPNSLYQKRYRKMAIILNGVDHSDIYGYGYGYGYDYYSDDAKPVGISFEWIKTIFK